MNYSLTLLLTGLLFYSCTPAEEYEVQDAILITNGTIISANEEGISRFIGFILMNDGKIIYAGTEKPNLFGEYQEVSGEGKFIIPGLMDSHVHLANTAGFNGALKNKYPELVEAYFEQLPKSYLYHGFTTLVDVNNYDPNLVERIRNSPLSPDIYTCGRQIQIMDDFNMEMEELSLEQRYRFPFLHDRYNREIVFPDSIDLTEHTAKRLVSEIKEEGGIGVKFAYEDEASGLKVSWAKPSIGVMNELALEANSRNLPLLLHAPSLEGHRNGLAAGVNIFAHGLWNWTDNFEEEFTNLVLTSAHREVLTQIAEKQVGYQLTFRAITGEQDLIDGDFIIDENLDHVYPQAYLDLLKGEEGAWGRKKILDRGPRLEKNNPSFYHAMLGSNDSEEEMWKNLYILYKTRLNETAKFLSDEQANFILGSDTPAMNMFTNPPGYNGFLEMKHMFDAGIPIESIFRAATFNNAQAFHLQDKYGSVEMGKKANLLILNSNPLESIDAYNDIDVVILHGKIIERENLSASNIQ